MVQVTKYLHIKDLEHTSTFIMVDENREYFVRGEGWKKAPKQTIREIPAFKLERTLNFDEFFLFCIENKEYRMKPKKFPMQDLN